MSGRVLLPPTLAIAGAVLALSVTATGGAMSEAPVVEAAACDSCTARHQRLAQGRIVGAEP